MQTWPYFRSQKSRKAIKSGLPVPVTSCWNGVGTSVLLELVEFITDSHSIHGCSAVL